MEKKKMKKSEETNSTKSKKDEKTVVQLNGIHLMGVVYEETSRGVSYAGKILLDEEEIGFLEHRGDGGAHHFHFKDAGSKERFNQKVEEYFETIGLDIKAGLEEKPAAHHLEFLQHEEIAGHLMDVVDFGRVLTEEERMAQLLS